MRLGDVQTGDGLDQSPDTEYVRVGRHYGLRLDASDLPARPARVHVLVCCCMSFMISRGLEQISRRRPCTEDNGAENKSQTKIESKWKSDLLDAWV